MGDYIDLLRTLNAGASEVGEVDSLLTSTRETFRLIEPWFEASSEHPVVNSIISDLKEQACIYFDAIETSIETAEIGYTFAEDAISVCEFLAQGRPSQEVLEFVEDMKKTARAARKSSDAAARKFRSVRVGIFEITKLVTSSTEQVRTEGNDAGRSKDRHRKRAHYATIIGDGIAVLPPILALVPHAVIVLPAFIPLVCLVEVVKKTSTRSAEVREKQQVTCEKAVVNLEQIYKDLGKLVNSVDHFTNWWIKMDTLLGSVMTRSNSLEPQRLDNSLLAVVHGDWKEVKRKYILYNLGVSRLQDFFPPYSTGGLGSGPIIQKNDKDIASFSVERSRGAGQIYLPQTMISIARCVEECRFVFDKLKPEHFAANGNPNKDAPAQLARLRILMKDAWEELTLYLRDFHALCDEVALSIHDLSRRSLEEQTVHSDKMWTTITELLTKSVAVRCSHISACRMLQQAKDVTGTSEVLPGSSRPAFTSMGRMPPRKSKEKNSQRRITNKLPPDIGEDIDSLHVAEVALIKATRCFDELVGFWNDRSNLCGLVDAPTNDTEAARLSCIWQAYQAAVETSLLSISKSCDSLATDVFDIPSPARTGGRRFLDRARGLLRSSPT